MNESVAILIGLVTPVLVDLIVKIADITHERARFLVAAGISVALGIVTVLYGDPETRLKLEPYVKQASLIFASSQMFYKMLYKDSKLRANVLRGK